MSRVRLSRRFFAADAATLARRLLGTVLVRTLDDGAVIRAVIDETEAYTGVEDRASHAFGGRRTPRNQSMWAKPGTAYVYFTYGMHYCFNIACGREHEPPAVLIRSAVVVEGLERVLRNRGRDPHPTHALARGLTDGPAKLCQALEIGRALDGVDLCAGDQLFVERGLWRRVADDDVIRTARVGVGYAGDWAHRPLRFVIAPAASARLGIASRRLRETAV